MKTITIDIEELFNMPNTALGISIQCVPKRPTAHKNKNVITDEMAIYALQSALNLLKESM